MRKTNWKIIFLVYFPFLVLTVVFFVGGALGAVVAWIPTLIIVKLFKIDMNVYYDHEGKKITKEEWEKLDNKVDYGFSWLGPKAAWKAWAVMIGVIALVVILALIIGKV